MITSSISFDLSIGSCLSKVNAGINVSRFKSSGDEQNAYINHITVSVKHSPPCKKIGTVLRYFLNMGQVVYALQAGGILWGKRNTFSGSYLALTLFNLG